MKIDFLTSLDPRQARLIFHVDGSDETLRVKRLPGRWYDHLQDAWIVPLSIGLTKALERSAEAGSFLGAQLLALVQEQEEGLRETLTGPAPAVTQAQLFSIPATYAADRAIEHHLHTVHNGDIKEYERVHGRIDYVPDVPKASGPRRREKKNKHLGRIESS